MDKMDAQERIEKYLRNQMDEAEMAQFEQDLKIEEALAQTFAELEGSIRLSILAGRASAKATLEQLEEALSEGEIRPFTFRRYQVWAAAAVFIACIAGVWWLLSPKATSPSKLYADNFQVYPSPPNVRSDESSFQEIWEKATADYRQGNYQLAADGFAKCEGEETIPSYLVSFYRAQSLLAQGSPPLKEVISLLEKTLESDNDYREPAIWYLGLTHMKQGDFDLAKQYFNQLDAYKGKEAQAIIQQFP